MGHRSGRNKDRRRDNDITEDPKPLSRTRIDTEGAKGYDHIVNQVVTLVIP